MDKLRSMKVFDHVVAENGFAACARKLGISPAAVTRLISDLEDHLGVRLLHRTTRQLALTPAGEVYLDRVHGILEQLEEAEELARSHAQEMSGRIRISSLPGMATHLVAPAVAEFRRRYPKVTIELLSDMQAARAIEANDLTLLTDNIAVPSETVIRSVVDTTSILCASPDYLGQHGEPRAPQDLRAHALLRLSLPDLDHSSLRLIDETDQHRETTISVSPVLTCNDHEAVLRSTLDGVGISSQALQVAAPMLRTGELRRILAPWIAERFTLIAAFASRRHMPPRTREFLDHLINYAERSKVAAA
ncbi:LysR family transcriptional regulator [Paucibacter sp. XJ19-41]|uniref:LysR family transcriptional regulator n=1 Tax=Paucibacter sp. XJ19-41 TaxID=2927824 RepID=UPI00234AFD36|nr:LysR family transcriptional regulator [Paucibacter sp. XJ19-41]MDC6166610.1 LysR family transcriptional regulator [Paucibacter sp. XJ19-41]